MLRMICKHFVFNKITQSLENTVRSSNLIISCFARTLNDLHSCFMQNVYSGGKVQSTQYTKGVLYPAANVDGSIDSLLRKTMNF